MSAMDLILNLSRGGPRTRKRDKEEGSDEGREEQRKEGGKGNFVNKSL